VHLDMAIPNFGIQESCVFPEQVWEVFSGGPSFDAGYFSVSDTPGLGTEVDENKAAVYPYHPGYLPTLRRVDGSVQDW
jgi:mannonate dehydratase